MYFMRATSLLAVGYLVLPSLNKGFIIIIIIIIMVHESKKPAVPG